MDGAAPVLAGLERVEKLSLHAAVEPDPERTDWHEQRKAVRELLDTYRAEVLDAFERVRDGLDETTAEELEREAAVRGLEVVGVLYAARQWSDAGELVARLSPLAPARSRGSSTPPRAIATCSYSSHTVGG